MATGRTREERKEAEVDVSSQKIKKRVIVSWINGIPTESELAGADQYFVRRSALRSLKC